MMSMGSANYTYGSQPHAATQVGSLSFAYDANGNMYSRGTPSGTQTIAWDDENRPVSVSANGSVIATFLYDGDGNRIGKTEGGETVIYINRYYEVNLTTGNATSYYYHGNRLVGQSENQTLKYVHQDHLTGTALMTSANGTSLGTVKYYPYGATRAGSVPTDKLFTGQRLDGTGLYYYNARYYDPLIGRFISADTIIPDFMNPQAFNRYSYCLNNPLKYVDPSGYGPEGDASRDEETYIIEESDGKWRVIEISSGATSGWYESEQALNEAWEGFVEQFGGSNSWRMWEVGGTYDIVVYNKDLLDGPITITLKPKGSIEAFCLELMGGYAGISLPFGNFVRWEEFEDAEDLVRCIRHEWFHDQERQTQSNWDLNYVMGLAMLGIIYKDPYNVHPDEVEARAYAGQAPYPKGHGKMRALWKLLNSLIVIP